MPAATMSSDLGRSGEDRFSAVSVHFTVTER
jgi:hypothetical protein